MPLTLSLHAVEAGLLLLLLLVVAFSVVAQRINVPYPIVLVVAGLGLSFVPHMPRVPLNPDLVFLLFLPPLLYAAAWQTNWREFRRNLVSIAMLAFGLVAFTVWGVATFADHFITALDWKSGFVLGAVVATTDAIAATSIANAVGLPRRIVDVLEGESLINDATGLLGLEFGLAMLNRGYAPGPLTGSVRLLWLVSGGLGVGLLLGAIVAWLERWVDDGSVEMVISIIVPYAAYLAGEEIHASGVLAVVACGLYLSRQSAVFFSPSTRIQVVGGWTALNFMLNGLVFVLIGLQLPYVLAGIHAYSRWTLLEYGAIFSGLLILLRLLWVFPGAALSHIIRTRLLKQRIAPPRAREVFVVGWTGMRGVVALAAAIGLPETLSGGRPFAQRNLVVFLTFSVILVTLVVQGLSLPALIRALGLAGVAGSSDEELETRRRVLRAAITYLNEQSSGLHTEGERHGLEDLLHTYTHRLEAIEDHAAPAAASSEMPRASYRALLLSTVEVERRTLIQLRNAGAIGDDVVRKLELELDLTIARQMTRNA